MNKTISFENPNDFLQHIKQSMENFNSLSDSEKRSLLMGSISAIEQLWTAQNFLSNRMMQTVACLNNGETSWGEKLAGLYTILECGQVTEGEMTAILKSEICSP